MLNDEGRCPRCGKYIQVWYDMTVDDDCIMADIYNWIPGIPGHDSQPGRFEPLRDDFKCPHCGKELMLSIKADPCIMAVSDFDDKVYVDWEEEEKNRQRHKWYAGFFSVDGEFTRAYFGYARKGKYWNGWAMPWFNEFVAAQIHADMDCEEYPFEHWTTNGLDEYAVWTNGKDDYEDGPEIFEGSKAWAEGKLYTLYPIGNGSWTWTEISVVRDDVDVEFQKESRALSHEDKVVCGMSRCKNNVEHRCTKFDWADIESRVNYCGCNCRGYEEVCMNVLKCYVSDCVNQKDGVCTKAGMLEENLVNKAGKGCPSYWNEVDWNQTLVKCNVSSCITNDGHGTCSIMHWTDKRHQTNDLGIGCRMYIYNGEACGEEDCIDPKAEHDQEVYRETSDEMILHDLRNDEMERRCK